jgi:hypothetical protein
MVEKMKDEWICGCDGIWMNQENINAFKPLTYINYFHVDVHEKNHHELNGCLKGMTI